MTPPARPDPAAALETAMYPKGSRPFPKTLTEDAEGVAKRLAEAGYVLVNADMLAEALDVVEWHRWKSEQVDDVHTRNLVRAVLAALQDKAVSRG